MNVSHGTVTVHLLADRPHLIEPVGDLRWREWGHPPEPTDRFWWIEVTRQEAGRDWLPVTWVAVDRHGAVAAAVGLGEFDIEERRDCPPWIVGMIVCDVLRERGIGRRLLTCLEEFAAASGYRHVRVANEGHAVGFYQRCGYRITETVRLTKGATATVLTKPLARA